ncbi:hypothetical protein BDV98DRAFT_566377 [Pterulicium gracile]|uniref:Uncharacterized protein n=1 Tax=Pterulicium gracile TaxID=1884261 RepID=A0A5C3QN20_9AGAR|nr:hypothetical protein BDV98DRAFT_566377 [Pterula gracilis]
MTFTEDYLTTPGQSSPRKSSRQGFPKRLSNSSLRVANDDDEGNPSNGRFSLAHELAVALMPEPSAGSRLLAEEFGIEYDEGAEGIDEHVHPSGPPPDQDLDSLSADSSSTFLDGPHSPSQRSATPENEKDPETPLPEQNPMDTLSENLESTNTLLAHLRQLDTTASTSSSRTTTSSPSTSVHNQPALEKAAADVIRHLNDTTRDREGQLRELLEYDREFRKIAGEVGGDDVLGGLDDLEVAGAEGGDANNIEKAQYASQSSRHTRTATEDSVPTTPTSPVASKKAHQLGDFAPQLASLRSSTTSLLSSLSIISDQTQVNSAATTDAGRKIRALKNKLGGWRADWDLAEQSRLRIEKWEVGIVDDTSNSALFPQVNGRKFVDEHLRAFSLALEDAAIKTDAIAARA